MDLDKLFEKLPYDRLIPIPAWQRMAAIVGVAVLILGLFYFLIISGKNDEIVKLEDDLAKVQKEVEDTKRQARKINELQDKMALLEAELAENQKQLPAEKDIPELLQQISNMGTHAGLEFVTFKPNPEVRKDYYAEVPVTLKIKGKFHNVLMFFDEVSRLDRIVTINNVTMQSGAKDEGATSLTVDCQAVTYRFVEKTAPPSAAPPGKGGAAKAGAPSPASAPPAPGHGGKH